jgi:hypothetical protein
MRSPAGSLWCVSSDSSNSNCVVGQVAQRDVDGTRPNRRDASWPVGSLVLESFGRITGHSEKAEPGVPAES